MKNDKVKDLEKEKEKEKCKEIIKYPNSNQFANKSI